MTSTARPLSPWALGLVIILLLGCTLRTIQYAGHTSLWFDEIALALNIEQRSLGALLSRPLENAQVAPVGFLTAEKAATVLLGPSETGFRLVPWLFSVAALFLFWRVARRMLGV